MRCSFRPLSGFYKFLFYRGLVKKKKGSVSVPCRGSISFYLLPLLLSLLSSWVSVPCRGSISFYKDKFKIK